MPHDPINHPDHYTWLPGAECIEIAQHFPFNLGNAIKYIWRAGRKRDEEFAQDIRKAIFYLNREVERRVLNKNKVITEVTPTVLNGKRS